MTLSIGLDKQEEHNENQTQVCSSRGYDDRSADRGIHLLASRYGFVWRYKHYSAVHRRVFEQHILLLDSRSISFRTDQRHFRDDVQPISQRTARTDGGVCNSHDGSVAEAWKPESCAEPVLDHLDEHACGNFSWWLRSPKAGSIRRGRYLGRKFW